MMDITSQSDLIPARPRITATLFTETSFLMPVTETENTNPIKSSKVLMDSDFYICIKLPAHVQNGSVLY